MAVRREGDTDPVIISVVSDLTAEQYRRWVERATASGANELHLHRLADRRAEREAIVAGLRTAIVRPDAGTAMAA